MAGVRFPYRKREPALSDVVGFNGGNLQDQLDRQPPYNDGEQGTGVDYSATSPDVVPPPPSPAVAPTLTAGPAPAIDPAALAPITPASMGRVEPTNESAPALVRHPGARPGKPMRPTREGMVGEGTAEDANRAYGEAVDRYEPQRPKWWKRALQIGAGVGSMIGSSLAHDERGVERAAYATGSNIANPRFVDETWKRGEQADVAARSDRYLGQRKTEAAIKELEARPGERALRERRLQKGVDLRGQRVSDQKLSDGLARYNQLKNFDPESPKDAGLKRIFEENYGLYDLPAKNDDKFEIKMVNGEYEWIPKKPGEVTTVTKDGQALVDPSRVADQSVKLPNGTVLDHLTPREAAAWEGKVYESAEDRKSREKIAANAQAGQNTRASMRGPGSAINPSIKGAVAQLSKFRALTASIEKAKIYYGTADGPAPDSHPAIKALYDQRDALESDMKKMYGQYLEMDVNGKPKGLRDDAIKPASTAPTYTEQDVRDRWKATPRNKRVQKTADEAVTAARAAHLIP